MSRAYNVIDADGHILEPFSLWNDYLDPAFRDRAPHLVPYDLRRTYSHWMELAAIPRTRRRMYMGHAAKDVTDLYEEHEVTAFLEEDAAKLRAFLKLDPPTVTLRVEQGGAA